MIWEFDSTVRGGLPIRVAAEDVDGKVCIELNWRTGRPLSSTMMKAIPQEDWDRLHKEAERER